MSRKPVLSAVSLAILAHLREHGPRRLDELVLELPQRLAPSSLRARLRSLSSGAWLASGWGEGGALHWHIHPLARGAVSMALDPAPEPTSIVPPRTVNLMEGTYLYQPLQPARPGALHHTAVASRGQRC